MKNKLKEKRNLLKDLYYKIALRQNQILVMAEQRDWDCVHFAQAEVDDLQKQTSYLQKEYFFLLQKMQREIRQVEIRWGQVRDCIRENPDCFASHMELALLEEELRKLK